MILSDQGDDDPVLYFDFGAHPKFDRLGNSFEMCAI